MDVFLEYIVPHKKGTKDVLKIVGILVALLVVMTAIGVLTLMSAAFASVSFVLLAAAVFGAYYLITAQNIEYEYIVTNGEIDVDMIINRRKRKRLITVHSRTFDVVAPVGSPEHRGEENATYTRVIDASSASDNGKAYFASFSKDGQRIKLIFEPTEKMLEAFKTFVPRNVFIKND